MLLLLGPDPIFGSRKYANAGPSRSRNSEGQSTAPAKPCASALTTTSVNDCFLSPQMSQRKLLEATEARVNA